MRNLFSLITILAITLGILYFPKQQKPMPGKVIRNLVANHEPVDVVPYDEEEPIEITVCRAVYNLAVMVCCDQVVYYEENKQYLIEYQRWANDKDLKQLLNTVIKYEMFVSSGKKAGKIYKNNVLDEIYNYLEKKSCDLSYAEEDDRDMLEKARDDVYSV